MAIKYTFGETILGAIDKEKDRAVSIADKQIGYKQRAAELTERVTARKEANELQKAMNTLKTKQLNAELTGMVDGQKTWSRQAWEQGRKSDLSMLEAFMTDEQKAAMEATGVDLKAVDNTTGSILGSIIGANLGREGKIQDIEQAYLPLEDWRTVIPEGVKHDTEGWIGNEADSWFWGGGIDQGEIRDAAKTYLAQVKADASVIRAIKKVNPKSTIYTGYVKNLREMHTDLTATDRYFHHKDWRKTLPANVDARKMGKEIEKLLKYLGE